MLRQLHVCFAVQAISEACDPSSKADAVFDATYSSDPSGRALTSFSWGQSGKADPILQTIINAINAGTTLRYMLL